MQKTDVLVIGGGIAGLTAAVTAKRHFRDCRVTLLRREDKALLPWAIPYCFGAGNFERHLMTDTRIVNYKIDLLLDQAVAIDRQARRVTIAGQGDLAYDRLVLATGSAAAPCPCPGGELAGVYRVSKDIGYLQGMRQAVAKAKNVVIVGGGLTGMELASVINKGWPEAFVTLVEMQSRCLSHAFDEAYCRMAEEKLKANGVNIETDAAVAAITGQGRVEQVRLTNGKVLAADLVILAHGVKPNVDLALQAGIKGDAEQGLWVDDYMRTSDPDIMACGDCAGLPAFGPVFRKTSLAAASEARVAGANLSGLRQPRKKDPEVFTTMLYDLTLAVAGLTERTAAGQGIQVKSQSALIHKSFTDKTVGAREIGAKMVIESDTGIIAGAQVHGDSAAAVREMMNIMAYVIQNRMRVAELEAIEKSIIPLYPGHAKEPRVANAAG